MNAGEFTPKSTAVDDREQFHGWNEERWLASLTTEELLINITDQWEHCDRSFTKLFEALNKVSGRSLDLFDIKTESREVNGSTLETFTRIWREDGSYNTKRLLLADGRIIDDDPKNTFSRQNNYELLKQMRDDLTDNGADVDQDVYVHSLRQDIYPAVRQTGDTLITLWGAIRDSSLNPVYEGVMSQLSHLPDCD